MMQRIALENGQTCAFLVGSNGKYRLRRFAPKTEITGVCGHGTLAAGFVATRELGDRSEELCFAVEMDELRVRPQGDAFVLDRHRHVKSVVEANRGRCRPRMNLVSFKRHRFPLEIIQHAVWLYARFTLSFRDIEDLLAERGIDVSNESVRRWFLKFRRLVAVNLRRSRPRVSARWHLDKMVIKIRDRKYWLWRAVDGEGEVLDFLVQPRRCAQSARRLLRKLLKKSRCPPERITTDKLKSYAVAIRTERLSAVHDQGLRANNRTENSHRPVRRRERKQQRFKSPGSAQRFPSIHAAVYNAFYVRRHRLTRRIVKEFRTDAFAVWQQCWLVA